MAAVVVGNFSGNLHSAGLWVLQAGNYPQQSGFPRPRSPQHPQDLTLGQGQGCPGQHRAAVGIAQVNIGQFDGGHEELLMVRGRIRSPISSANDATMPRTTAAASAIPKLSAPGRDSRRTM